MDTVTYPHPAVDAALSEHFAGLKISLLEKHADFKEASGGTAIPWAPTFRFTDSKGREIHRAIGYYDPADFTAELTYVRAQHQLGRWRFDDALPLFEEVAAGDTRIAPAAGYYAGVALYIQGKRDMAALKERWNRLRAEKPGTEWAEKAAVIDDWNG